MTETNSLKLFITAVHCWQTDQAPSNLQTPLPLPECFPIGQWTLPWGVSSVPFPFQFPFQLHYELVSSGISSLSVQNILMACYLKQ